jgi:hypothetical protein
MLSAVPGQSLFLPPVCALRRPPARVPTTKQNRTFWSMGGAVKRDFPRKRFDSDFRRPFMVSACPSAWTGLLVAKRGHTEDFSPGLYTTGRTPCGTMPERTTPSRSPFGARMQRPEPAPTEQSQAL